ncbi:MAG: bifunctional riboflavin kinase/FAD synthetase [Bacteroidaceae bacterium]|nr:bifunctional riboflavin kinase/FAD synthetase [Bacteroidaceae bacterium]
MERQCVATIGFFDGVHRGHQCLVSQVCRLAHEHSCPSLVITFDKHPRQVLHADYIPQLLSTLTEKKALLMASGIDRLEVLPFTVELSRLTALQFMQQVLRDQLQVKTLVMGYDHRFGCGGGEFADYMEWGRQTGIDVVLAHELDDVKVSSSRIRRFLAEGDVRQANMLLGYPYALQGMVMSGHQVGRHIGFPTANLKVQEDKLLPALGVYAVRVSVEDEASYDGMLCIGHRPTLNNGDELSVEANLFDFSGDLYGKKVKLMLVDRLRDEQSFPSVQALQQQLEQDAAHARRVLNIEH